MKQRITIEQLNELSDTQKQKLRELWKPRDYDVILYKTPHESDGGVTSIKISHGFLDSEIVDIDSFIDGYYNINDCLPLLSVCQMIEILSEILLDISIVPKSLLTDKKLWSITITFRKTTFMKSFEGLELCDILWQAVKEILN